MKEKEREKLARDLLHKTLMDKESPLLSLIGGKPIVKWIDTASLPEPQPVYPDLMIRHEDRIYVFEFVADSDRHTVCGVWGSMLEMLKQEINDYSLLVVWVGDRLPDFPSSLEGEDVWVKFRVVDIRDPFDARAEMDSTQRQILSRLKTVHEAHGGLFTRLLQLPPAEHQREFY